MILNYIGELPMNKIEKQNLRDAKVEELILKVDFVLELLQSHLLPEKEAKTVIKRVKSKGGK